MTTVCEQGNLPLEDVFEQLSTSRSGLSSADVAERLQLFGANRLEEKRVNSPSLLPLLSTNSLFTFPEFLILKNLFLTGEQGSQVHQFHVEPTVMGNGGSSNHGTGLGKWGCKYTHTMLCSAAGSVKEASEFSGEMHSCLTEEE
jgi:hypothetical protein